MKQKFSEDVRYQFEKLDPETVEEINFGEMKWIEENIFGMCTDKMDTLLILSWIAGRFMTRKAKRYPVLEIIGSWEDGNNHLMQNITKIFCGYDRNIMPYKNLTAHNANMYIICNEEIPLCIENVKVPTGKYQTGIYSIFDYLLRTCYEERSVIKNIGMSQLETYDTKIPLIFSTESGVTDLALKTRCTSIKFEYSQKTLRTLRILKSNDNLYKFGKFLKLKASEHVGTKDRHDVIERLYDITDSRAIDNVLCLWHGFEVLEKVFDISSKDVINFNLHLRKTYRTQELPKENIELLLELVKESGNDFSEIYVNDERGHYANFPELYKMIEEEHRQTKSIIELLSENELKKQLKEIGFIKTYTTKKFNKLTKRAYVFIK